MDRPALDAAALRAALIGPAAWRAVDVVAETGSTNADLLARSAKGDDIDGAVLLAEHQTAGRGRHGRHWSAPVRSQLALSVGVAADTVPTAGWGWLTLATGVAVADAIAEVSGIEVGLKWPNDVMAGDGKLAGILAEVAAPQQRIVVGLGLNVTMTAQEAPDPAAVSLAMLGSPVIDRNIWAGAVLRHLADRIAAWRAAGGADDALVSDYRRHSCTLGAQVRADIPGDHQVLGLAEAIDDTGRLVINTGDSTVTVSAGDVTRLRRNG
ncbi:biotin--[acetyl-CoA-carboxylase] ligase [Mycolicibacter minnesotensis]|uniref:Biotin--[acetyl-CoA-carboxylase] ligase n=1 Tax=Mycolicibacter minnesotensis TaxID=1118379 RepID=A0A7I7R265_9MYCO|nr:biotin--[acetyl-CoA-carboxylase] ligase [Mycolicibacter minnesotensis]ORB02726.1 biotin--[acetyl-CoA-carboxylase] ligase [Mycolicibacter minnesotensis]BBY32708.1 biotin--[acetyl-CoA-carboxylase] ligase [Mycolicibacter minnesotensis]